MHWVIKLQTALFIFGIVLSVLSLTWCKTFYNAELTLGNVLIVNQIVFSDHL